MNLDIVRCDICNGYRYNCKYVRDGLKCHPIFGGKADDKKDFYCFKVYKCKKCGIESGIGINYDSKIPRNEKHIKAIRAELCLYCSDPSLAYDFKRGINLKTLNVIVKNIQEELITFKRKSPGGNVKDHEALMWNKYLENINSQLTNF